MIDLSGGRLKQFLLAAETLQKIKSQFSKNYREQRSHARGVYISDRIPRAVDDYYNYYIHEA